MLSALSTPWKDFNHPAAIPELKNSMVSPLPILSVIVPTHETRDLTLGCFASLAVAVHAVVADAPADDGSTAVELLLVDDGSQDGTAEAVAATDGSIRVLRNGKSLGFTSAANQGLAAARGQILLLLNSDTEVEASALGAFLRAFESDPNLGIAGGRLVHADGQGQWSGGSKPNATWALAMASGIPTALRRLPVYGRLRPESASGGTGARLEVDWLPGAAMAIRREVYEALGPMDEGFHLYAQDLDYCLRARRSGWRIAVVNDAAVVHLGGATVRQQRGAARVGFRPEALWADLLHWADKEGDAFRRRFARALLWGGRWRRSTLRIRRLFVRQPNQRHQLEAELVAFKKASRLAQKALANRLPLDP